MNAELHPDLPSELLTQADVDELWQLVVHPLGWPNGRLWFFLIDADNRPCPLMTEIDQLPELIDDATLEGATTAWSQVLAEFAPGGRIAFLLCRPGGGGPTSADRHNARKIYDACRAAGVPTEVIHLATDVEIRPLPLDAVGQDAA